MQRKNLSDELVTFYEEQLCTMADVAYRLAFGMTLSTDRALLVVRKAYEEVASRLEELRSHSDAELRRVVVEECWKAQKSEPDDGDSSKSGNSAIAKSLKAIPLDERAALLAVDIAGLHAGEAAKALTVDEKKFRVQLANARKALIGSAQK